jgi:hypothetical protein
MLKAACGLTNSGHKKGYIEDKYFLDIGFLIGNIKMNMRNTS